jgi:hypothetical protein
MWTGGIANIGILKGATTATWTCINLCQQTGAGCGTLYA